MKKLIKKILSSTVLSTIVLSAIVSFFVVFMGLLSFNKNLINNEKELLHIEVMRVQRALFLFEAEAPAKGDVLSDLISQTDYLRNIVVIDEDGNGFDCRANDSYMNMTLKTKRDKDLVFHKKEYVYREGILNEYGHFSIFIIADGSRIIEERSIVAKMSFIVCIISYLVLSSVFSLIILVISKIFKKKKSLDTACTIAYVISVILINTIICSVQVAQYFYSREQCEEYVKTYCMSNLGFFQHNDIEIHMLCRDVEFSLDFIEKVEYDGDTFTIIPENTLIKTAITNYVLQTLMLVILSLVLFREFDTYFDTMRECERLEHEQN